MTDKEIIEQDIDLSDADLTSTEKDELKQMLIEEKEAFALHSEVGSCRTMTVDFDLNEGTKGVNIRPYKVSEQEKQKIEDYLKKLKLMGIVGKGLVDHTSLNERNN